MARRYYSSTAARTTLATGVDDTTTTLSVTAVSGWPTSFPYTLVLDQDTVNEELVEVSARSGTTLTVTRGVDGTSAVAHSAGAAVNHGVSARDFDEPNAFINGTGTVTETLLATGSVTEAKLGTGAVTSTKILDGTIMDGDINASAAIAQSKISNLTSDLASKAALSDLSGLFYKPEINTVAFNKTGAGTAAIRAGIKVWVNDTVVSFAFDTTITMPGGGLTAGTDYFIYVIDDGSVQAVAATGTWPTPVASPPANSRLIGGFHYAPGGNATGTDGGDTTPAINEYSFWDLKWKPVAADPRGMTLVANRFWSDIYLLNRDPQTNGTSKHNVAIADGATGGTTTCIIPTVFGGNGSTRYSTQSWWNTAEALSAFGKRLPRYSEFGSLAYGVKENFSVNADPVNTGLVNGSGSGAGIDTNANKYTSKWGVIQATGTMWVWGDEFGGGNAAASWANVNGGRGQVYQQENAVILGGAWDNTVYAGSRSSFWSYSPSSSDNARGGRGVCDHLILV